MHVLPGLLCANEANLPELRRRIAAAAATKDAAHIHVNLQRLKSLLTNYDL
jgi:hypothetical protein